ncbi:MAG: type II toxin-antitoxin system RelE/ParE family toxin [Gemmatimonadales bacterium]
MTPRLSLQSEAQADLIESFEWYEQRSIGLGHEFLRIVRIALAAIERAPEQFPVVVDDIRRVRMRRFPYNLFYVVLPSGISVIAVLHERRDPRRWQARR